MNNTDEVTPAQARALLRDALAHSTAIGKLYRHPLNRRLVYSDGVHAAAEAAGAFWLVDAIASHLPQIDNTADNFQIWRLRKVAKGEHAGTWTLTMRRDKGEPAEAFQRIPYSDFPDPAGLKLYAIEDLEGDTTLMLPSEY